MNETATFQAKSFCLKYKVEWLGSPAGPQDITDDFALNAREALHQAKNMVALLTCKNHTEALEQFKGYTLQKDWQKQAMTQFEDLEVQEAYVNASRAYMKLFSTYGTHFVNTLYLGGKATFIKTMQNSDAAQV